MFLNRILVVEGKEDAAYLSNYISSEIVITNGYELSEATISYLKDRPVLLLLDPDEAGASIRNKINKLLHDVVNIEVDINKCTRGIKNGVAECDIEEVLSKLTPFCMNNVTYSPYIKQSDLYNLKIIENKDLRSYVCGRLNLGVCNNKTLLKRLIYNNIQLDELNEIIKEYKNGNK